MPTDDDIAIDDSEVIRSPSDLTNEWLSDAVRATVTGFTSTRIGTGLVSEAYRINLSYEPWNQNDPPASVVLKLAAEDEQSRKSSALLGLYEREARFYDEVAPKLPQDSLAHCYYTQYFADDGTFSLVESDAAPAVAGDELEGTTFERAKLALQELGKIHSASIDTSDELDDKAWLNRGVDMDQSRFQKLFAEFSSRYKERVKPEHLAVAQKLAHSFDLWLALQEEEEGCLLGLMHGDYRLDNLLFDDTAGELTVVDWQTVQWGHVMNDVSYFLGAALTTPNRREWEDKLIEAYYEGLGPEPPMSMKTVKQGVREHTFYGVIMAVVSPIFVKRTERGDEMFMVLFERHCQHVLDRDSLSLLPQPRIQLPPGSSKWEP